MSNEEKSYDDVEVTETDSVFAESEEEVQSTETEEATDDAQEGVETEETEAEEGTETEETEGGSEETEETESEGEETTEEDDGTVVEYNGKSYTEGELEKALQDSVQKEEWEKSHTEKSQKIGEAYKIIKPIRDVLQELDQDAVDDIIETITDALGADRKAEVEKLFEFEGVDNSVLPHFSELNDLRTKVQEFEGEKVVQSEMMELINETGISAEDAQAVVQRAVELYDETSVRNESGEIVKHGTAYPLKMVYRDMNFDKVKDQAAASSSGVTVSKKVGAKKITKPRRVGSYDEIDTEGFKLFE